MLKAITLPSPDRPERQPVKSDVRTVNPETCAGVAVNETDIAEAEQTLVEGVVGQRSNEITVGHLAPEGSRLGLDQPPVSILPIDARTTGARAQEAANPGKVVVLAEDDAPLRRLISIVLTSAGFDVVPTASGDEALRACEAGRVSLLITDIMMPGMRGPELIRKVRRVLPALHILCTSGYSADIAPGLDMTLLREDEFLEKPFLPSELIERVREILG